jgi:histidinol-phosphate aminotransferase
MTDTQAAATSLRFSRHLDDICAYVPGWPGLDRSQYLRLDLGESTVPLPRDVVSILSQYLEQHGVQAYPAADRLSAPLAAYCGVRPECILATNGSDQAIDLCLRAFLNDGDRLLVARPEFPSFTHVATLIGAQILGVPYHEDLSFPYTEFREAAASGKPDLIVIINPNNPTGTAVADDFVLEIASDHPDVPVIVDEAYFEFTGRTAAGLVASHRNVVVLRTFSKAFAMAGLRLGYVVAVPAVIDQIAKLRNPFDVNGLAIVAAEAQLADLGPMRRYVRQVVSESKPLVNDFCQRAGIAAWPGEANFVLVKLPDCRRVVEFLRDHGILVRPMSAPLLRGMLRVTMGTPAEMSRFIKLLEDYLCTGGAT